MTKEQALQIVAEAMDVAISKGAFGLVEVSNIVKALEVLNGKTNETPQSN